MDQKVLQQRARAFDYLFDAVVVTDLSGVIIDWNQGSEELYGYSRCEALDQHVGILYADDKDHRLVRDMLESVAACGKWTGEVSIVHKDGRLGWIESVAVSLLDDHNRVVGALGIHRDISDRVRNEERLAYLAHHDQLTGLPNRHLLMERLQQLITHSGRRQENFGLLYIDLNDFKLINDNLGHDVGDAVLQEVAGRFAAALRVCDTVARIGGDEFVVLVDGIAGREQVEIVAANLTRALRQPFMIGDHSIAMSASIGIATYPESGKTCDELLRSSDRSMYQMKYQVKHADHASAVGKGLGSLAESLDI